MIDERGTFDHLVSRLNQDDKQKLLEKIKNRSILSSNPLIDEKQRVVIEKPEERYQNLSILQKIWYWIVALFSGRTPRDIYMNSLTAMEGRLINERYPGMFDHQENLLKGGFRREVQNLKDAARFLYTTLEITVQRDRGAFFGYLGSLKMPALHEQLIQGSDPDYIASEHPDTIDAKLRVIALEFIEKTINSISEDERHAMYENTRTLFTTKALASFLYDRLIMAFTVKTKDDSACPVAVVRSQLYELANILYSLKNVPSTDLLSALFLFTITVSNKEDADQDAELQKFLQYAERSLAVIRNFNKNVPLLRIIRCATRDFDWEPVELSGGEEWFSVYKNYWFDLTNERFGEWIYARKNAALLHSFETFFAGMQLEEIENALSGTNDEGIPVDGTMTLSFLLTFHKRIVMPGINTVIRPILVDGEFYKKENRAEFMEAYNVLIKLDDTIKKFDSCLAKSGEYGKLWMQIENDMQSIPVRRRKTQALIDEVNQQALKIGTEAKKALVSMQNVLVGILERNENARYDTLINFAKLAGKGSTFNDGLAKAIADIEQAVNILEDIDEMNHLENAKSE
ncbi:MAG: DUF5312 domain-containing protein [Spirochaetaceae bacterium]|jgi:hypothetical protein|nr:DUF5312 domain-containing protein [Spirochaetaceae bacterium]